MRMPGNHQAARTPHEVERHGSHVAHPLRPYSPLIINAAITGMVPRRARVPDLPVTPDQIIEDVRSCFAAGATIVHLHARAPDESPEWRREAYEAFIPEIRASCPGIVVCVTTSGRTFGDIAKRADVLKLEGEARPDMASLTLGSLNFRDVASVNSPESIRTLATFMAQAGIRPELEIFDTGMAYLAHVLRDEGLLPTPMYANLLLGSVNTAPAQMRDLAHLIDALPAEAVWAAAGIGAFQLAMNALAVFAGGHVRTGLEDNPYFDHATRSRASNSQLVRRIADLAATAGRPISTTAQTRAALGLPVDSRA
jgi:3-keto-5-aminohexanoate cleavage enzyme